MALARVEIEPKGARDSGGCVRFTQVKTYHVFAAKNGSLERMTISRSVQCAYSKRDRELQWILAVHSLKRTQLCYSEKLGQARKLGNDPEKLGTAIEA